jgi:hypothetical protein
MAMTPRAKWMASIIADAFKIGEFDALEVFRNQQFAQIFDDFQKGIGPSRIFVYYQTPYKISESGEIIDSHGQHKEFIVSDGERVKLKGKGLYFVRTTDPDSQKDISKAPGNDNDVLFGEISQHTVTSLNTVINQVYKPLVDNLETADWDKCPEEQKSEFS